MKFVHKLFSGEITPWARWVRRWYGEFGIAQAPSTLDTPIWRTFKKVFALYRQLTVVATGSGVTVSFWLDNWHNAGPLFARLPALFSHCTQPTISVADALRASGLLLPLQPRLAAVAEMELDVVSAAMREVRLAGGIDARSLPGGGAFRSSDVYNLLLISGVSLPLNNVNWDNFAPTKVRIFFWIARHGNTRTRAFLHRLGCLASDACPFCSAPEELHHMLFSCPRLGPLRAALGVPATAVANDLEGICDIFGAPIIHLHDATRHTAILLVLWIVWKSRNRKVFDNVLTPPRQLSSMVSAHCMLWLNRLPNKLPRLHVEAWCASVCEALNSLV
jgi:hypothetical protein